MIKKKKKLECHRQTGVHTGVTCIYSLQNKNDKTMFNSSMGLKIRNFQNETATTGKQEKRHDTQNTHYMTLHDTT